MERIAIDMDDVLADALGRRLERYNTDFGASLTREALRGQRIYDAVPAQHRDRLRSHLMEPGFFGNLEVIKGAQDVVYELAHEYDIYIVTAAMEVPTSLSEKYVWLLRHFPFLDPLNFVFCGHKHIVAAHYLIDDTPSHFETFTGEGIVFTSAKNVGETRYRRVDTWEDVRTMFLA